MRSSSSTLGVAAGLVLAAALWAGARAQEEDPAAELTAVVAELRIRNEELERSLVQANQAKKEASDQLTKVRQRLNALGRGLLDGGDDLLVQATADLQVLGERVGRLESTAGRLRAEVSDYLKTAVASDPQARLRVETSMRELDEVLGLVQKPAPATAGSAGQARVVSIDTQSGLLVFNVGEKSGARIGTAYRLTRGNQNIGTAIVADVRRNVCGAFVEQFDPAAGSVRLGDTAILITE